MIAYRWNLKENYTHTYTDAGGIANISLTNDITDVQFFDLNIRYVTSGLLNGAKICDVFQVVDSHELFVGSIYSSSRSASNGYGSLLMRKLEIPMGSIKLTFIANVTTVDLELFTYNMESYYV